MTNIKSFFKKTSTLILALVTLSFAANSQQIIDRVIVNVGGEYILHSELMQALKYQKEQNPGAGDEITCPLLEQIIAQKVLIDQAKLDSITIDDSEIESQLDYRVNNILSMMNGDESKFQEYYGKSIPQVKDQMRDDLRQQLLAQRIQQSLISGVSITPKEVLEFYDSIPKDSLPYLSSEVELAEVVITPQSNEEENNKSIAKLEEIRAQILTGEVSFEESAKKYSMDGSAQKGGDLGWQKRGTFVPEFEAVAYNLDKDEVSEVVESEFGYHLIRLDDRRGNTINASHILIIPDITEEDKQKTKDELLRITGLITSDSLSFENAVKIFSDKKSQSYSNNGRMQNPATGTNFFETGDLPPDIYFEIEELAEEEISEPIESIDERGTTLYRIIKVVSRTKPHKASLELDYSRIKNFAKESKKNQYYNDWMAEKLGGTFISIDEDYQACPNLQQFLDK